MSLSKASTKQDLFEEYFLTQLYKPFQPNIKRVLINILIYAIFEKLRSHVLLEIANI